jgi:cadmium resistance protein CadD (predicted permease)
MSLQLPIALAVTFALIFTPNVYTTRAQQKSLTSDQKQVVDTVSTIFTAARADDVAKFVPVATPAKRKK